jgi:hypothetical protein
MTRAHIEVIGVGEDQLGIQFVKIARLQGLDIRLGSHGRKDRQRNGAVRRMECCKARGTTALVECKAKGRALRL